MILLLSCLKWKMTSDPSLFEVRVSNHSAILLLIQVSTMASQVAQMVKNLPAIGRPLPTLWVWSLGEEDPLKKGMATYSSIIALANPIDRDPGSSVHGIHQHKNIGVGCQALLQGIFLTQVSNSQHLLHLLAMQTNSLLLSHLGSPENSSEVIFYNPHFLHFDRSVLK